MDKLLEMLKQVRPDIDFTTEKSLIDDGILDSEKIELSAKKAVYFIDMTSKKTIENLEKIYPSRCHKEHS